MSKFTPGPWNACAPSEALHAVRAPTKHNSLGMIICDVGYGDTNEVNIANAHLIAASPDLAAALLAILAEVEPGHTPHSADSYLPAHLIEQAKAALEKAGAA